MRPVVYEPYTAYGEPGNPVLWIWDCPTCYASQAEFATQEIARRAAERHAAEHPGVPVRAA